MNIRILNQNCYVTKSFADNKNRLPIRLLFDGSVQKVSSSLNRDVGLMDVNNNGRVIGDNIKWPLTKGRRESLNALFAIAKLNLHKYTHLKSKAL